MSVSVITPASLIERFEREAIAEQHTTRIAAISRLQSARQQLEQVTPAHNAAIASAVDDLERVRLQAAATISDAESKLADARGNKSRECYPLERQIDQLTSSLETTLAHPAIATAMAQIADDVESSRHTPDGLLILTWAETARQQLLDLRFDSATPAEIDLSVTAILASRPC